MARAVVMSKSPRLCAIDQVTIDVCYEETHQIKNTVTDHPVEEGVNISDHVRPEPDSVTLHCFISNTPLSQDQTTRAVREGDVQFQTTSQSDVALGDVNGRGPDSFRKLLKIRDDGTLIKIVTTLKTYGNGSDRGVVLESLQVSRTSKNYDGLEFTATLKEVRVVKNRRATDVQQKDVRTKQKKHSGATTPTEETPTSTAFKAADTTTGWAAQSGNKTISGFGNFGQGFLHQ